jgi:hypothetical protein
LGTRATITLCGFAARNASIALDFPMPGGPVKTDARRLSWVRCIRATIRRMMDV